VASGKFDELPVVLLEDIIGNRRKLDLFPRLHPELRLLALSRPGFEDFARRYDWQLIIEMRTRH
jgi:hypothetical protein